MAVYEDFIPYVAPEAPGASEMLMVRTIRDACIELCDESQLLQETLDPTSIVEGVAEYDIEAPLGTVISLVRRAWFLGRPLEVDNAEGLQTPAAINPLAATRATGQPHTVIYKGNNALLLTVLPDADYDNALTLHVSLKPSRASTSVADMLLEDWAEEIGAGALARLLGMNGQPFSNADLSLLKRKDFMVGVNKARLKAATSGIGMTTPRLRLRRI